MIMLKLPSRIILIQILTNLIGYISNTNEIRARPIRTNQLRLNLLDFSLEKLTKDGVVISKLFIRRF